MQKVAIKGQAVCSAFFRVKLGCKNIIACNRGGKAAAVIGLAGGVVCFRRMGVVAVHEIEPAAVGHASPHRVAHATRGTLKHLVPAHLRHLVAAAIGLRPAGQVELAHVARNQAQAGRVLGVLCAGGGRGGAAIACGGDGGARG